MTQFIRILKNTFQHLSRNPWHAVTAIFAMTLTFFVLAVFVLIGLGSEKVLRYLEKQPQVTVFFDYEKTSEEHVLQVKQQLESWDKVESVRYVSQEEGAKLLKQFAGADDKAQEFVTPEILPPVLEISARQIQDLPEIAERVGQDSYVWKVQLQQDVADKLRLGTLTLRLVGLGLISFLALVSLLVTLVVISSNISSFGKEVEVMKLVGAAPWYIRWPFILEGVVYGLISSILAAGILWGAMAFLQQRGGFLEEYFKVNFFPVPAALFVELWLVMVGTGAMLGVIGSLLAIRRHLKV